MIFGRVEDEEQKAQINVLERAFRAGNLTSAVKKELNLIRRNSLVGESLLKSLIRIYNPAQYARLARPPARLGTANDS